MKQRVYRDFLLDLSGYDASAHSFTVSIPAQVGRRSIPPARVTLDLPALEDDLALVDEGYLEHKPLARLGAALANALLPPGRIREEFEEALRKAGAEQGVRLRLHIHDAALHQVPWEYTYLPLQPGVTDRSGFLCLNPRVSLTRFIPVDADPGELRAADPRRVSMLAVMASPPDMDPLDLSKDRRALRAVFEKFKGGGSVGASVRLKLSARWASAATLREGLLAKPEIFHFSGHGEFSEHAREAELILYDAGDHSRSAPLPASALARSLQAAGVRLVFLGACDSARVRGLSPWAGIAPRLMAEGIPAVIAMQYAIEDQRAIDFGRAFYSALLSGWTVDEAVSLGRLAVAEQSAEDEIQWGVPTLYLRAVDGVLFSPAPEARSLGPRVFAPRFDDGDFTGRQEPWQTAAAALGQGKRFYLHGAYGIGKTRLSSELFNHLAAQRAGEDGGAGGFLWLDASGKTAREILALLGKALEIPEVEKAAGVAEMKLAMQQALGGPPGDSASPRRETVLVGLDGVEDADAARQVLEALPNCPVLLNGGRFDLAGMAEDRELEPLAVSEAADLFYKVAGLDPAAPPEHASGGSPPERARARDAFRARVEAICADLGGMPLGVRLAARMFRRMPDLDALEEELRLAPEAWLNQDKGLTTLFSAAYAAVKANPHALHLWVRLASYPTAAAPEDHLREGFDPRAYRKAAAALLDLELVRAAGGPGGVPTLSLHPLIGRGLWQVEEDAILAEQEQTFARLDRYAEAHARDYARLDPLQANYLRLLEHYAGRADWNRLATLMRRLFSYLRVRGLWQTAFDWLAALVDHAAEVADPFLSAWVYLHRGILSTLRADTTAALRDIDRANELFRAQANQPYEGKALYRRAGAHILRGELDTAQALLTSALALLDESVPVDLAGAHERLGSIYVVRGEQDAARAELHLALEVAGRAGDAEMQGRVHTRLGEVYALVGQPEKAVEHFQQALASAETFGGRLQRADIELQIGHLHLRQGRHVDALAAFRRAAETYEQFGFVSGQALARQALGSLALARKELDEAEAYYTAALKISEGAGLERAAAYSRLQLSVIAARRGQNPAARAYAQSALDKAKTIDDRILKASALSLLGVLAFQEKDGSTARSLLQQAVLEAGQIQDRQAEATAYYYQGLLQAQEGYLDDARQSLGQAQAAFTALQSVNLQTVQDALDVLGQENPAVESRDFFTHLAEKFEFMGPGGMIAFTPDFLEQSYLVSFFLREGIYTIRDLLEETASRVARAAFAKRAGIPEPLLRRWADYAGLFTLPGMTETTADLLTSLGVRNLNLLAEKDSAELARQLENPIDGQRLVVEIPAAQVARWVDQAQKLTQPEVTGRDQVVSEGKSFGDMRLEE